MIYHAIYHPALEDYTQDGAMTINGLLKGLENAGNQHSDSVCDGAIGRDRAGKAWILTDWQVEIYRRPRYCIPLQIQTWQRAARATFALFREYLVSDGQPGYAARAVSRLVLMDMESQRIIRPGDALVQLYTPEDQRVFEDPGVEKLREPDRYAQQICLSLRRSDIDYNEHVHNLCYLDFALEALPLSVYQRQADFHKLRIVYKSPVKAGTTLVCRYAAGAQGHTVGIYGADGSLRTLVAFS